MKVSTPRRDRPAGSAVTYVKFWKKKAVLRILGLDVDVKLMTCMNNHRFVDSDAGKIHSFELADILASWM